MPVLWRLTLALMILYVMPARADQIPEPSGYRLDNYRAPTPPTLTGAKVVGAAELHRLMVSQGIVVIDVLPQPPKPDKLPPTTLWHPPVRHDIPGSVWLANSGYGALNPEMEAYFKDALERLTLGDKARALAFYCEAECWMSWNAAKRAVSYGYPHVYWFPGGMQEWSNRGYPSLPNMPIPLK